MLKKKVFILFPDGGGLRNFAFSDFKGIGDTLGYEVVYWNNNRFPLKTTLGFDEVTIDNWSVHPLTPLYARARKHIELNLFKRKLHDAVYDTYKFPLNFKGVKHGLKSLLILLLIRLYASEKGLESLKHRIETLERKTAKYQRCRLQLEQHRPQLVFCSNQRNTQAISALMAAKDLGIPTVCFVQSWDNVPKAMQVLEADYYFVWSALMKQELLTYYPYLNETQVVVTGTPQFEMHYKTSLLQAREVFFNEHGLDVSKKYICFSGDDATTSPLDQYYLEDLVHAVRALNTKGYHLGIIYRKCPFDISNRYAQVLEANQDLVKVLNPYWKQIDGKGDMMPLPEDFKMLYNVCEHSEFVTNVCSSTVFDFVIHHKPCIYYNYEQPQLKKGIRDIGQNYNYVHFRSMPTKASVLFCTDKRDLEALVQEVLEGTRSNVADGLTWFGIVAGSSPTQSSRHIWEGLEGIINTHAVSV